MSVCPCGSRSERARGSLAPKKAVWTRFPDEEGEFADYPIEAFLTPDLVSAQRWFRVRAVTQLRPARQQFAPQVDPIAHMPVHHEHEILVFVGERLRFFRVLRRRAQYATAKSDIPVEPVINAVGPRLTIAVMAALVRRSTGLPSNHKISTIPLAH